jgi:hypothetical protein
MVILPYSDGERRRFAELAELYWSCRDAFRDLSVETQANPAAGSRCDRDRSDLLRREPPVAERSEQLITWAAQLYLYAGSEHVGGLAALYQAEEVLLSPLVLARSALENSAHTIWILGHPRDSAEDRLARAFLEAIFGAEQAKMQAGRLRGRAGNEHKARTEYFKYIKKDARATFEQPHQDGHGRPLLHGHRLPPPEQIVMEMNRLVSQPLADELVQGTYGLLSNFVHPTFYALQELFTVGGEAEDRTPALNRDINFHERLAGLVVAPFYQALGYVASYHGWTSQRFEELNRDIVRGLPNLFVAGPSPGPFGG